MAHATFQILTHRVGEGGLQSGTQVLRIQQLLFLNGYRKLKLNGHWSLQTAEALIDFKKKQLNPTQQFFLGSGSMSPSPDTLRPSLQPRDPLLFDLAFGAGVLIQVAPGGRTYRGSIAFEYVHQWCAKYVSFSWSDHAVWGLEGYSNWVIVTKSKPPVFDTQAPVDLNCTLYVNLMMSVWYQGNAHTAPFDPSVKTVGDTYGLLSKRYHYAQTARYSGLEDIMNFTRHRPDRLYCLEAGHERVGHEALLYHGKIYECNVLEGCQSVPLEKWMPWHSNGWISGPSPS
jgi:hypothetical protein